MQAVMVPHACVCGRSLQAGALIDRAGRWGRVVVSHACCCVAGAPAAAGPAQQQGAGGGASASSAVSVQLSAAAPGSAAQTQAGFAGLLGTSPVFVGASSASQVQDPATPCHVQVNGHACILQPRCLRCSSAVPPTLHVRAFPPVHVICS